MDPSEFKERYIAARRAVISLDFTHLNAVQQEAVMHVHGPLLLLAGAGSGKTTVLINRIANLLKFGNGSESSYVPESATEDDLYFLESIKNHAFSENDGTDPQFRIWELCAIEPVEPWRIISITFTNKAAGELKDRLKRTFGPGADDIWASTFHSACVRILRRNIDRLGYDRSFAIYDTSDSASLMKRVMKDLDIEERNFPHKTVLSYISRAKDEMIPAEEFLSSAEQSGDVRRRIIGRAYVEYSKRMKSSNSLDFDDLILLTVRLFHEHPDVLEYYQKKFKHVLVDEYQDTNRLQYALVSALAGGFGNICVVGDDDQSIYKFRGATIENILNFEKHFKGARLIRLEQNYRSTRLILNAANDVIKNNVGRKGKKLWTESDQGEIPELHISSDERTEAQLVADIIISSASKGRNMCEHAVLYRMNAQSNQLESAFKRAGIPYRVFGGTGFYDRAEIKDMLAYLCIIHNPNDDVRLLRVINNPPRGIGNTTVGRLAELAASQGKSVFEVLRESQNDVNLKSAAGRIHLFADLIDELRQLAETSQLDELYDALLSKTGYIKMLEAKGSDEELNRIENVRELKTNIIGFMRENGGSLFDFLSETALFSDLDRDDQSSDRVLMMTMHSAKGLEFDTVFVVGAEEGVFPGMRSIGEPGEMEEERRLCYVAMTRAERKLYFTSARQRMIFGKTAAASPSRFVREISSENIEIIDQSRSGGFGFDFTGTFAQRAVSRIPNLSHSTLHSPNSKLHSPLSTLNATRSIIQTPNLIKGDTVDHKAFGRGLIVNISSAGGDALLEIAFEKEGTKRVLLNSAARFLTKVEAE